jgi:hypothetical protein
MKSDAGESYMKRETLTAIIGVFLTITAILSICFCFIASPATAASSELAGYFKINYDPAVFSQTEILGNEAFNVTIHGNATCIKDLPAIEKGRITGNVTAVHSVSGKQVTLNSTYTITIDRFPYHLNDSVNMTVTVLLQFPAHEEAGEYSVTAETIKAEICKYSTWLDVTDVIPASEPLGAVNYTPAPVTPTPSPTASPVTSPTPVPTFSRLTISLWHTNASAWRIDGQGHLLEEASANSSDGSIRINISANTTALGPDTEPLDSIVIAPSYTAPTPGKGYQVVAAYNCKPDSASFVPAIELTLSYNPANLPAGSNETKLVVAYFDNAHPAGKLITDNLTIDTNNHTVTFHTSHFCDFAILAPAASEGGASTSSLPLIIALGTIALGLVLMMIAVIRKWRQSLRK